MTPNKSLILPKKRPALEIVTAARMPKMGARTGAGLFDAVGDVVVDCGVPGCGWHAAGPRADVKKAQADHARMFHTQIVDPLVTHINLARQ